MNSSAATELQIDLLIAANAFRDTLIPRADGYVHDVYPWWHGWAIHDGFVAGHAYARAHMARAPISFEDFSERVKDCIRVSGEFDHISIQELYAELFANPPPAAVVPIDVLLFCPRCGTQHIDAPEPGTDWDNPPHKSHLCHHCKAVWRPADVATNGVASIQSKGSRDTQPAQPVAQTAGSAVRALVEKWRDMDYQYKMFGGTQHSCIICNELAVQLSQAIAQDSAGQVKS